MSSLTSEVKHDRANASSLTPSARIALRLIEEEERKAAIGVGSEITVCECYTLDVGRLLESRSVERGSGRLPGQGTR
jgi:hypothetical protein